MSTGLLDQSMNYLADKTNAPIETFSGTRGSGLTSGDCRGVYDKWTNTVRINFYGLKSSNGAALETLFTIPTKYRRSDNPGGGAVIGAMNGGTVWTSAGWVYIDSSGQIKQGATNYLRAICGFIEYSL